NGGDGVLITDAGFNTVGGNTAVGATTVPLGNVISANRGNGVHVSGSGGSNSVLGNFIGTDPSGTGPDWLDGASHGNRAAGVLLDGSTAHNSIGGIGPSDGNVVSANYTGIVIQDASSHNLVQGNKIGTDVTGTRAVANSIGVEVTGSN